MPADPTVAPSQIPALIVSHGTALAPRPGGLQICTREYIQTLRAAGLDATLQTIDHDTRLATRIARRLRPDPYPDQWRPEAVNQIATVAERLCARFVCLNLVNLAPLASSLRGRLRGDCRIVLLSHGLESVDYLHTVPGMHWSRRQARDLGRRFLEERAQRGSIDHVLCLTSQEAEIERWLGARHATAIPRTALDVKPLDWRPDPNRLGFVGTLDHPPTRQGIAAFLDAVAAIAPPGLQVRVVGGPEAVGRELSRRFAAVRYLGPLDEDALRAEAASWSAFVHPLFCWARGCSTKMAVALAWQLPVVTTPAGVRGYQWRCGELPIADSPKSLAALACTMMDHGIAHRAREQAREVGRTMPTVGEVGAMIRGALLPEARDGSEAWA